MGMLRKLFFTHKDTTPKQYILEQLSLMQEIYQDKRTSLEFRKFTAYYFRDELSQQTGNRKGCRRCDCRK